MMELKNDWNPYLAHFDTKHTSQTLNILLLVHRYETEIKMGVIRMIRKETQAKRITRLQVCEASV